MKGYFTVEASLIMPVVVMIWGLMVCLNFYVYDSCILFQDTYSITFRASAKSIDDNAQKEYILKQWKSQCGDKYFSVTDNDIEVTVNRSIHIKSIINMNWSDTLYWFRQKNGSQIAVQLEVKKINPAQFVRKMRRMEKIFT